MTPKFWIFVPLFFTCFACSTSYLFILSLLFFYWINIEWYGWKCGGGWSWTETGQKRSFRRRRRFHGVASGVVKPTKDVNFKVKIVFQARILHNQAKLVPTDNFEEKPKLVPTGVRVIELNIRSFFTTNERWRDREELLGWVCRQASGVRFTISIDKSSTITPYMTMQCEKTGEYKPPKTRKKPKLEGTGSRKCNCPFRLKCFFEEKNTRLVDRNALWNSQPWLYAKVIRPPSCRLAKCGGEVKSYRHDKELGGAWEYSHRFEGKKQRKCDTHQASV